VDDPSYVFPIAPPPITLDGVETIEQTGFYCRTKR
jgi:hypothetical protein